MFAVRQELRGMFDMTGLCGHAFVDNVTKTGGLKCATIS